MTPRDCLNAILLNGLDDWIQAAEVASIVRMLRGELSLEDIRNLSIQIIQELLEHDLVEVGEVVEEKGFVPWNTAVGGSLERIKREWVATAGGPELGEVCWLNLTEHGEMHARKLWSERTHTDGP